MGGFFLTLSLSLRTRVDLTWVARQGRCMIETLRCACEAAGCDRDLAEHQLMLTMETSAGTRHAYECDCGAVTVTVTKG